MILGCTWVSLRMPDHCNLILLALANSDKFHSFSTFFAFLAYHLILIFIKY